MTAKLILREKAACSMARGIEYIYDECPFAEGSQSIYYEELFVEKDLEAAHLHTCPKYGQPTSTADLCSFCRLIEKAALVAE